ncbi:MAG: hypothetical protein G8345_03245 [Magnetococcales bacterium]|nr:hypothetical protein [Magnetococcales bacterium]NGZ25889.1 hypothetical protein [Magnetococcales bacterium]
MTPDPNTLPELLDGDDDILSQEVDLSFDEEADGESILLEKYSPPVLEEDEEEELAEDKLFDAPPEEWLSPPVFAPRTVDPAVTGKPIPWVVGIRMGKSCMTFRLHVTLPEIRVGDGVILDTKEGEQVGWVVSALPKQADQNYEPPYPGKILGIRRRLTQQERENVRSNTEKEQKTKQICWRLVDELKLDMRIARVEFSLDGNKAVIYFTAENRVDFRELVKLLAKEIRARVELRQIGVRDETRLLGGLGPCGRVFCCSMFLTEFRPVSVRMAKNQDLSLNPESISGLCGRLMCCLSYENEAYLELRKNLPKLNSRFLNKDGIEVVVRAVHPMTNSLEVQLPTGDKVKATLEELTAVGESVAPEKPAQEEPAPAPPPPPPVRERPPRRQPRPVQQESGSPTPAATRPPSPQPPRQEGRNQPRRNPRRPNEGQNAAPAPTQQPAVEKTPPASDERPVNRRRRFHRRPSGNQGGGTPPAAPPA